MYVASTHHVFCVCHKYSECLWLHALLQGRVNMHMSLTDSLICEQRTGGGDGGGPGGRANRGE
jgi:hypothetical protein